MTNNKKTKIEYQIRDEDGGLQFFHNGIAEPYMKMCKFKGHFWKLSWAAASDCPKTDKNSRKYYRFRLLSKKEINLWNAASQKRIAEMNSLFASAKDSDWFFVDQQMFPVGVEQDKWTHENMFNILPSKYAYIYTKDGKKMPSYDLCDEYMADCIAEVLTQDEFELKYVR